MASKVTIKIGYNDGSKSLTESFTCADSHPSADVIKQLEMDMRNKWEDMGGSLRDLTLHTKVS